MGTNTRELPAVSGVSEQREGCGCAGSQHVPEHSRKCMPLPWAWPFSSTLHRVVCHTSPHTLEVFCGINLNHTGWVPGPVVGTPTWAALRGSPAGEAEGASSLGPGPEL